VITQTRKTPKAVPVITVIDPSKEYRKGSGVECDDSRSSGTTI
jgi:hypothetical protein